MFTEADPFKPSRVSTRKRRSATLRSVLLAVFCIALAAACDPIYTRGLAVTHGPAPATGREYGEIAALVSELATRHGLRPYTATPFDGEKGMECYDREWPVTVLCTVAAPDTLLFYLSEMGFRFSPEVKVMWQELEDAIHATFDAAVIRDCTWRNQRSSEDRNSDRPEFRTVCVPVAESEH